MVLLHLVKVLSVLIFILLQQDVLIVPMDDALSLDLIERDVGATTKICGKRNVTRRDVRATQNGILQMCHLICAETEKILTHTHSSLENELILLNLQTPQCTRHSFLP